MMTIQRIAWPRTFTGWRVALACCVVACSNDVQCLELPCPSLEAAEITVTAGNAPAGIAGLTATVTGAITTTIPCNQGAGPATVCSLQGGRGGYHVALSAPGYQSTTLDFTVLGKSGGCTRCEEVDTRE
ncbi:MAG: hypothetical protein ACHQWU_16340, partial [Gemmatimonadales bacterium]